MDLSGSPRIASTQSPLLQHPIFTLRLIDYTWSIVFSNNSAHLSNGNAIFGGQILLLSPRECRSRSSHHFRRHLCCAACDLPAQFGVPGMRFVPVLSLSPVFPEWVLGIVGPSLRRPNGLEWHGGCLRWAHVFQILKGIVLFVPVLVIHHHAIRPPPDKSLATR